MKRYLWSIIGGLCLLALAGCVNNSTTRRLNALYDTVNEMRTDMVELEDKIEELNTKLREIEGPPTAEVAVLQESVEGMNRLYFDLAEEVIAIQESLGLPPMETLPAIIK